MNEKYIMKSIIHEIFPPKLNYLNNRTSTTRYVTDFRGILFSLKFA